MLTFNEEPNLPRTLSKLGWAHETLVVDSFSTDASVDVARAQPRVRILSRAFDSHLNQWTAGVGACNTLWILALDADYELSPELIEELTSWTPEPDVDAYFCRFHYCVHGRALRSSLYPARAVLFRKDRCRYVQDGHTQLLEVKGRTAWLKHFIYHDDRKPIERWLADQSRYAKLEVEKLTVADPVALSWPDRIRRKVVLAPMAVFVYLLLWKGLILDGWPGWVYVCQRLIAELILSLRMAETMFVGSEAAASSVEGVVANRRLGRRDGD